MKNVLTKKREHHLANVFSEGPFKGVSCWEGAMVNSPFTLFHLSIYTYTLAQPRVCVRVCVRSCCQHLSDRYKVSICYSGSQERGTEQALSVNRYHDNGRACPILWPLCAFIELAHRLSLWLHAMVIENTSREEGSKKEGCASLDKPMLKRKGMINASE